MSPVIPQEQAPRASDQAATLGAVQLSPQNLQLYRPRGQLRQGEEYPLRMEATGGAS